MPPFLPGQPIPTATPEVVVDAGLKPGRYRFRLVVTNAAGVPSLPSDWIVTIGIPAEPLAPDRLPTPRRGVSVLNRLAGLIRGPRDRFPT